VLDQALGAVGEVPAHDGADGGILVVGTGSIGLAVLNGRQHRVGGWGLPLSDEGSGAWIGREVLRRVLMAYDGRLAWTPLLRRVFERHGSASHAIVQWAAQPYLAASTRQHLVKPVGDPLYGAFLLARAACGSSAANEKIAAGRTG